jgi:hypothetical protein
MSTSPRRAELEQKWPEWFEWQKMRYRPIWGEIRPTPDGQRRTIFSKWPARVDLRTPIAGPLKRLTPTHTQSQTQDSPPPDGDSDSMNSIRQSSIQEPETVETHTLQGSEGQLRKPTDVVRADVIAAHCPDGHNKVNALSDDLLALQAENRLELDLSGKAEVISSLKEDLGPDFQVSKSKGHPNCSLVRPVNPEFPPDSPALLRLKTRRKEMHEIEHFLSGA